MCTPGIYRRVYLLYAWYDWYKHIFVGIPVVACGFVVFWPSQDPKARPGEGGAGSTIDFSTLFHELDSDSDFTSDDSDDGEDGNDGDDGNDVARAKGGTDETANTPPTG